MLMRRLQKTLFAPKRRSTRQRWRLWLRLVALLALGLYLGLLRLPLSLLVGTMLALGLLAALGISGYLWQRQRRSWRESVAEAYGRRQLDSMQPQAFEALVAQLFAQRGYRTELTPASGDFGVDVLAYRQDERLAIQVKHYAHKVSGDAVREAVVGMQFYDANQAWVVTNSYLTPAAKQLAAKVDCCVLERDALLAWLEQAYYAPPASPIAPWGLSLQKRWQELLEGRYRRALALLSLALLTLVWLGLYGSRRSLEPLNARVNSQRPPSYVLQPSDTASMAREYVAVEFISEPEGVVLWLNGEPRGIAPVTLSLPRDQLLSLSAYADPRRYVAKHTQLQVEEAGQVLLWLEPVP